MYLINIQYDIINIDCTRGLHGKFALVDIGFLGVTISHISLSCSQYLYKIKW